MFANYIIYKDGSKTKAENGIDNIVDYSGTDAATVIQNTIDNLPMGGDIYIKNGTYITTAPLDLSDKNVNIIGEHRRKTILLKTGGGNVVNINNTVAQIGKTSLRNIMLDGGYKTANGIGLYLDFVNNSSFDDLCLINCDIGICMEHSICNVFKNPYAESCNIGIKFDTTTADNNPYNNQNIVLGGEFNDGNPGVLIYGSAVDNVFYGTTIEGTHSNQVIFKSSEVAPSGWAPFKNVFDNCYFETSQLDAIFIDTDKDTGVAVYPFANMLTKCYFFSPSDYTCFRIQGHKNHFMHNYLAGPNGKTVVLNISGNENIVAYNNVHTNNVLSVVNTGANNIFDHNEDYATESNVLSNTFAIDSAGIKTVTIAHGLAITPAIQDCYLTILQNTVVTDWSYSLLMVTATDVTNVTAKINILKASATVGATAKFALKTGKI
jgi:hypothetical protein